MGKDIKVVLEVADNGSMKLNTKNAKELKAAIDEGTKAAILLSKGISDPTKAKALEAQVLLAKQLTKEINQINAQSRGTSKALASLNTATGVGGMMGMGTPGLERGTASANMRGGTRDFARQAQGMGGLVHVYATFAANIWAVTAAFSALSTAYESMRLEDAAEKLSTTLGTSMKNLASDLRDASGQAVSFKESLQFAAMGTQAGLSAKQLNSLVTAAKGAANVLGRDVNDAINRMIRGTVKMEQEILDELGIFVRAKQAYKDYSAANNLAGEESLTQSERVKAYADAVEKASKKYEEFAKIEDPFSKLKTTIADAGTELLNFVNKGITPFINTLSESKNLVEGLLVGGGLYLTKLAIPAVKDFKNALFDTTKAQQAASAANKQALIDLESDKEKLLSATSIIPSEKLQTFSKSFGEKLGSAIPANKIGEKIQKALLDSVSAEDFQRKMSIAIERTATGKELAAKRGKDPAKIAALTEEAQLIRSQSDILTKMVTQDTQLVALLDKKVKSAADLAAIEASILSIKEKQGIADTKEQRSFDRQRTQSNLTTAATVAITSLGAGGSIENLKKAYDEARVAAGKFGAATTILRTGVGLLTTGITALLGVVNFLLLGWLALDLVILPVLKKFGFITDASAKATEALSRLADQNKVTTETFEKSDKILANTDVSLEDKLKTYQSLTSTIEAQSDATATYLENLASLGKLTALDKFGETLKGLFVENLAEKSAVELEKTLENFQKIDQGAAGQSKTTEAFREQLALTEIRNQKEQKYLEAREKYLKYTAEDSIYSNTAKVNQAQILAISIETYNTASKQLEASKERLTIETKTALALQQQKIAAAEIAISVQGGIKEIENVSTFDPKAFRFENQALGQASQSSKTLTARAFGAQKDEDALKRFNVLLSESQNNLEILKVSFADSKSPEALDFLDKFGAKLVAIQEYTDAVNSKQGAGVIEAAKQKVLAADTAIQKSLEITDKQAAANKLKESQVNAAASKAEQERLRAIQRIEEWKEKAATRELNSLKTYEQQLNAQEKLNKELEGYNTFQEQSYSNAQKLKIIEQERAVELAALSKDTATAMRGAKNDSKLKAAILVMETQMKAEIEEQYNSKLKIAGIDMQLENAARRRVEYENTIYNLAKRTNEINESLLEAQKSRGQLSPEAYTTQKFNLDTTQLDEERKKIEDNARTLGMTNEAQYTNAIKSQLAELDVKYKKLGIEKETTEQLRKTEVVLGNLAAQETLIASILEKQEGRGIFNTSLINLLADTKIAKINAQIAATSDSIAIQNLELEKQNVLYENQLAIQQANKRNFMDISTDSKILTIINEAAMQADRFRASIKDGVTGTFDAVYSGMDAAIDELTTKMMESMSISFKDLVTTFRNTAAEEFRKMSADQLKMGFRDLVSKGIGAITGKEPELRSVEEQQLSVLQQIAINTGMMASTTGAEDLLSGSNMNTAEDDLENARTSAEYFANQASEMPQKFTEMLKNQWDTSKGFFANLQGLLGTTLQFFGSSAVSIFKNILSSFSSSSSSGGGGLFSSLLSIGMSFLPGMGGNSAQGLSAAGGSYLPTTGSAYVPVGGPGIKFAMGGVMTDQGALALNKYANGGIANSPQLAMYGEGRQPEAYVPLPDGRTIPVTMQGKSGGGQVNVSINITDNSTTSETSATGTGKDYAAMAKLISSKVREELINQKRPGGILY